MHIADAENFMDVRRMRLARTGGQSVAAGGRRSFLLDTGRAIYMRAVLACKLASNAGECITRILEATFAELFSQESYLVFGSLDLGPMAVLILDGAYNGTEAPAVLPGLPWHLSYPLHACGGAVGDKQSDDATFAYEWPIEELSFFSGGRPRDGGLAVIVCRLLARRCRSLHGLQDLEL